MGILIVAFCNTLMISCKSKSESYSETIPTINFSEVEIDSSQIVLSDLTNKIDYYFLETSDSCLISDISDAYISDSMIVVFDRYLDVVRLFSKSGHFIQNLDSHRKVSNDSARIHQVYFDESNDIVYLYSIGRKVHKYSINGKFIKSFSLGNIVPFYIYTIKDDFLLFFPYPRNLGFGNYSFGIFNEYQKVIHQFGYREVTWKPSKEDRVFFPKGYQYYDTLCFWDRYCDTLYGFYNDQLVPRYSFVVTQPLSASEKYYEVRRSNDREGFVMYNFVESKNHFFIESIFNGRRNFLIYNKQNDKFQQSILSDDLLPYAIENDIDFGPPFWPNKSIQDKLLMFISAERMIKYYRESSEDSEIDYQNNNLRQKISNIKIQDNPIIMSIHIYE